jgi:hypothetical protein
MIPGMPGGAGGLIVDNDEIAGAGGSNTFPGAVLDAWQAARPSVASKTPGNDRQQAIIE